MAAQDVPVPVIHLVSTWYQFIHSQQESHNLYLQIMVTDKSFFSAVVLLLFS